MKLKLTLIATLLAVAAGPAFAAGECGTVKLYDKNNTRQRVYGVKLLEVDGNPQFNRQYLKAVPVGSHTFKIGEQIPNSELSQQVARWNDRSIRNRDITIDVQPDVLYVIGAKFDPDKRSDVKEYWAPIILRDEGHPCTLK